jgi:two-component system, OmpR family, response regulator MprA
MSGMDGARALVVDDDETIRAVVRRLVELAGGSVVEATSGEDALRALYAERPDIVVLDIDLATALDGWQVLERIRQLADVPVVMLSGHDDELEKVRALQAGADDYVTKPFALEELLARLRALLRRTADGSGEALRFADLELDPGTREVRRGGEPIEPTRTEFSLLELFMINPRQVLTRSVIFERVWGYDFGYGSNSLDVYIGYLRRKTETGGRPRLIQTVRGVGYALREG